MQHLKCLAKVLTIFVSLRSNWATIKTIHPFQKLSNYTTKYTMIPSGLEENTARITAAMSWKRY